MKKPTSPGKPGRVKAIGQGRSEGGQFTKKLPSPINEEVIQGIVQRRQTLAEQDINWRPTRDEWDILTVETRQMFIDGHTPDSIAEALSLPEHIIRRALARGAEMAQIGQDSLATKEWGTATLVTIIERCLTVGELEEARKAVADLMRLEGHLTNSPGVQFNVGIKSEEEVSVDIRQWIQEQNEEDRQI
ncbi:MAG: hypothetical protein ACRDGA_06520 [Bacteroidota bacterium]